MRRVVYLTRKQVSNTFIRTEIECTSVYYSCADFANLYCMFADIVQNKEYYNLSEVRPPFTYASLIRQVSMSCEND